MIHELVGLMFAVLAPPTQVVIETADGRTIEGLVEIEQIDVSTSFGSATIRFESIQSIEFGDVDIVVTSDQTRLRGETSLDGLTVRSGENDVSLPKHALKSLVVLRAAALEPGRITDGIARNRMTYHLRAPEAFEADQPHPAIVILHGSNMNSKSYVETIIAQWPALANKYILIGINGEQRNADSPPEDPTFNYTYVNYVGRSKFKGYPGTDRESPALVAEVIAELKERHKLSRVFVGGHSQGGFLTYSIMMNSPELIDGAFPISGGLIVQCEPTAYEDAAVIAAQKKVPLAIVHGSTDPVVDFAMSRYAYEVLDDAGFTSLRLLSHDTAGHRFAFLPLQDAIDWLEMMSAENAADVLASAGDAVERSAWRDATSLLAQLEQLELNDREKQQAVDLRIQIEAAASADATALLARMRENADNGWVDDFFAFREQFGATEAGKPVLKSYATLRAEHQPGADELFNQSRGDFQRGEQDAGYAKYKQIVDSFYASSWYRLCSRSLEQRGK